MFVCCKTPRDSQNTGSTISFEGKGSVFFAGMCTSAADVGKWLGHASTDNGIGLISK